MQIEFAPVPQPDELARAEAYRLWGVTPKSPSSLGGLYRVGAWLAACQCRAPVRPLTRPRVVVFAADHGVAVRGVSANEPVRTREELRALRDGTGRLAMLADAAGAGLRVENVGVEDTADPVGTGLRVGSGSIDVADALTVDEATAAVRAGVAAADAEIDEGADLVVPAELGVGVTTPSSTLVAALTDTEPVAVVGRGSGVDDNGWMRKTVAVRDAMRRARPVTGDPVELLATAGGSDLAALAGFLAQAAVRRTPVVLDGLAVAAAALVAEELAPGARAWWLAAHRSTEPAQRLAFDHLDLAPVVDLGIGVGGGAGAAAMLPLVLTASKLG